MILVVIAVISSSQEILLFTRCWHLLLKKYRLFTMRCSSDNWPRLSGIGRMCCWNNCLGLLQTHTTTDTAKSLQCPLKSIDTHTTTDTAKSLQCPLKSIDTHTTTDTAKSLQCPLKSTDTHYDWHSKEPEVGNQVNKTYDINKRNNNSGPIRCLKNVSIY